MRRGLIFSVIIILILISFVSAEGEIDPLYGKPQIDIKFTPTDSVETIGIVRTNEPFAIYGNVQNQPTEHYIEVVLPENCTFSGDSEQKSFNSKTAHNFKFIQFICNEEGIYNFKINLESSNKQILASDIESIYINNDINIDDMKANPYIKKSFIYDGQTYTDRCVSLDDLKDDYPGFVDDGTLWGVQDYILEDGNTISMPRFMCPPGGCKDGVCLKHWSNNCMDSDKGYGEDIFVK
jgi:hypothetical protein